MGMYTGLRCKIIIKEEYKDDIEIIVNHKKRGNTDFINLLKSNTLKDFYKSISRAHSIPGRNADITFWTWNDINNDYGFDLSFDILSGLLKFETSLKNYDNTIEYFLQNILPKICEKSYHIETLYEQWDSSLLHEIKNGELIELSDQIFYGWECDIVPPNCIAWWDYDFTYNNLV